MLLTVFMYIVVTSFCGLSLYKFYQYARHPLANRWELYPVPWEPGGRREYGGSYHEEAEWWTRPRRVSLAGGYKEMFKEILFMKNLFINRRKHWYYSYAMHLGIYLLGLFTLFLLAGAITELSGLQPATSSGAGSNPWAALVYYSTFVTGLCGTILAASGSAALFLYRISEDTLREYSGADDYFSLLLIFAASVSGMVAWSMDPGFNYGRHAVTAMLTLAPIRAGAALTAHILLFGSLLIYIPLTKISHYVGKYFAYHRVLWDNEPNLRGSVMEGKVIKNLAYKPRDRWSSPHTNSDE
ncbi:respiratory nitrate reductase subunit gamma [Pelotomaculum propionicicum]|uniref:respiratory nitrate reductase subunit gamma n=1 Tax=Pelotomaculum propionicicum TaxID=258475 RepID=UPI003B76F3A5